METPYMDIKMNHTYESPLGLVKVIGTYVDQVSWRRMVQVRVVGSTRGYVELEATVLGPRQTFRF